MLNKESMLFGAIMPAHDHFESAEVVIFAIRVPMG